MMKYKIQKLINKLTFGLTEMGAGFGFRDIIYNFKYGIKNLKGFFWVVWKYRGYDYVYSLNLLRRGLEQNLTHPSFEIDETRIPKEEKLKRVIQLLKNVDESPYIEMAEKELGKIEEFDYNFDELNEKDENGGKLYSMSTTISPEGNIQMKNVFKRANEIEDEEWEELFDTLKNETYTWWS